MLEYLNKTVMTVSNSVEFLMKWSATFNARQHMLNVDHISIETYFERFPTLVQNNCKELVSKIEIHVFNSQNKFY